MQPADLLLPLTRLLAGLVMLGWSLWGFRHAGHQLRHGFLFIIGGLLTLDGIQTLAQGAPWPWMTYLTGALTALILLLMLLGYVMLAAFLMINGVRVLRREGRTPANALALCAGLWLMLLPLVPLLLFLLAPLEETLLVILMALYALLLMGSGYVGFCFLGFLASAIGYRRLAKRFDAAYIIILGAGLIGDRVTPLLAGRLDRAMEVYRTLRARVPQEGPTLPPLLIPSGGQGPDEVVPEAVAMRTYLREQGIPEEHILLEDQATTTLENLRFSKELMDRPESPVYVATSDYHVYRAAVYMKQVGLRGRVVGSRTARYYVPSAFLREFAAIMVLNRWVHVLILGVPSLVMITLLLLATVVNS